jgi:pyruvate dehydrogenase E2 component (dihydrolipoamide acetyltransferase)
MEALSPTMEEGQLVKWLKSEGDTIAEGDVLAEIETDKATMELVARGSGVLQNVTLKEGGTAPVGEVIAVIAGEGEADGGDAPAPEARAPADSTGISPSDSKKESDEAEPAGDEAPQEADGGAKRKEPAKAAAQATDAEQPSGRAEPSTETKAAAPEEGSPKAAAPEEPEAAASDESGNGREGRVKASPLARRLAEEAGVELSAVEGTGPGGRITKRDIEAAAEGGGRAKAGTASGAEPAAGAPTDSDQAAVGGAAPTRDGADSEEVPVTQMRKAIAKRLAQSIGPIPTFYLTIECDMTRMADMRERTNVVLEKDGIKASINDFIIKAVAAALARHPEVNASWGDKVIVRHHRVHIGVAVAVEDGLITPIVRDADAKRVREIAVEVKELAGRAREKKLKPEEYTGATFSISNLGMFGITEFTAIINPPESGILAIGAMEEKVVVEDGEMVVRPRMRVTMSCDHRVVDGAMGAKFLQTVRELIEDPMMIIA